MQSSRRARSNKEGIWATEEELEKSSLEKLINDLIDGKIKTDL
jgi:hypothetical protein